MISHTDAPAFGLKELVDLRRHFCYEITRDAQDLLRANFAHAVVCGDVAGRNLDGMEGVDIVTAGFPCQPFSGLGLGHGRHEPGGRGALVDYTIEATLRTFGVSV